LSLAAVVTAARMPDRDGAKSGLTALEPKVSRRRLIWADQAYAGELGTWVWQLRRWRKVRREIVQRPDRVQGFPLRPTRWIVERTLGWFQRYRRLRKEDALLPQTSEAIIQVVMIHLMIRRLARMVTY
jgi:transposase